MGGVGGVALGQGRVRKRTITSSEKCDVWGRSALAQAGVKQTQRSGCRDPHGGNKEGKCDNQRRKLWSKFTVAVSVTVQTGVLRPK